MDFGFLQGEDIWITQVFIVVFLALLADFIQRRVVKHVFLRLEKTENPWDDAFLIALRRPLSFLIWIVGLSLAAEITSKQMDPEFANFIEPVRDVAVIVAIAWFLVRFIKQAEINLIARHKEKDEPVDITTM